DWGNSQRARRLADEEVKAMRKENSPSPTFSTTEDIPSEVRQLVSLPPTLPWESKDLYFAMMASFAQAIQPDDLITWMLIKDLADNRLEIARYRSIKAALLKGACTSEIDSQRSSWSRHTSTLTAIMKDNANQKTIA